MIHWQLLEHGCQCLFRVPGKQLIDIGQIFPLRGETLIQISVEDKGLEQVGFTVVPEVVTFAAAGVADDDIGENLRHHGITVQIGHTVPGIAMLGVNQIQNLDLISVVPKQFRCISVHFGFGIGNQDGLASADGREKSISDDSSGLHRAAGTKDSTVPIESGVFWETNKLSFLFAQDHASSFVRGGQLQD